MSSIGFEPRAARQQRGAAWSRLCAWLHCIRKERGWSDDEYRDILQQISGQRSAADLDERQLARVVAQLSAFGKKTPSANGEWAFIHVAEKSKRPLLRKIFVLCRELGVGRTYAEGVARRHSGGTARRLEMMSYDELYKVTQALANTLFYRQQKQAEQPAENPAEATA